MKTAPVAKRIYLTGSKLAGFTVLIKDNAAAVVIWTMPAPTVKAGNAIVRALRASGGVF